MIKLRRTLLLLTVAGIMSLIDAGSPVPTIFQEVSAQNPAILSAEEENVVEIYREVSPTVVSVRHRRGSGSGVIIDPSGVILTNAHVVGEASSVTVDLADGRTLTAEVLGSDPTIDIAVLRVPAENLPAAPLGDSDLLEPGQAAIAIGNPFGLERTITIGVISAVNRSPRGFPLEGLVQTDAAINPGNSGGPLIDSQGQVIAINTAVLRPQGGAAEGLGFGIPINMAQHAAQQILTVGRVIRPFIGISYLDLTPEVAERFDLAAREGIIVGEVAPQSPAAEAGIQQGDIITAIDDSPIVQGADLRRTLRQLTPGTVVTFSLLRDDQTLSVTVELATAPTG